MKHLDKIDKILLTTVVTDSNDAITVQKLDGTIVSWNRGATKMYGYTAAEALGKNIDMIVQDDADTQMEFCAFMQRLKIGDIVESFETKRVTKNGTTIDVWLTVTRLKDSKGAFNLFATTERDITEKKRMARERKQTIADLQKALDEAKILRGLLPICASCKAIRDDKGYWQRIESYFKEHSKLEFSHGFCPDCLKKLYPELFEEAES